MIQLLWLAFGPFAGVEPLNSRFSPGHRKMRLTVDGEPAAQVADSLLHERLVEAFPGLRRHECRGHADPPAGRATTGGIVLLADEPSANQAHLLEHLLLEMLSFLDRVRHLSGVTCAYTSPPERNDVFVECEDPATAGLAALVGVDAMNAALAGEPLTPLYPDVLRLARALHGEGAGAWPAARLVRTARIPLARVEPAIGVLARTGLLEHEAFTINFSGEPHYRFVGAGRAGG